MSQKHKNKFFMKANRSVCMGHVMDDKAQPENLKKRMPLQKFFYKNDDR